MKVFKVSLFIISAMLILGCGGSVEDKSSTEKFNDLANEEGFAEMHPDPIELNIEALGSMEKIPMEEGEEANIYSVKREGAVNYVLVFHEWWGLNNHIMTEADKLYEQLFDADVTVIAVDLYDGNVAQDKDRAGELMKAANEKRCKNIISSVLNEIPDDANIVTIGWCFGGGWSLKASLAAEERTKGCVMYYGMPVEEVAQLEKLNSDVLFIFAENDKWINKEVADKFKSNMEAAKGSLEVLAFDADHAFANPSSERYVEEAAQEANAAAIEYLRKRLID